jgi:hypothetical protein
MIEAANKNLKYRFLYHKHIADYAELFLGTDWSSTGLHPPSAGYQNVLL